MSYTLCVVALTSGGTASSIKRLAIVPVLIADVCRYVIAVIGCIDSLAIKTITRAVAWNNVGRLVDVAI